MERNFIGAYAPSTTWQWTKQAVECYEYGGNCAICGIKMESQPCQMKAVVVELVKNVGKPNEKNCRHWSFYGYGRKENTAY